MRNKLIVIFTAITFLFITIIAGCATMQGDQYKDQHIVDKNRNQCSSEEKEFCTHLPLLIIDTMNQEIPGENRDGSFIDTNLSIIDNKKNGNHLSDKATLISKTKLRYRGNSSMHFDKKGYLMKLITDNGEENNQSVLGMEKNDQWVLHGPYLDKSLIRNYLWYHISSKIMDSAPNSKFCELFVNGEYRGLYLLVEAPSRGEKARMPISKYKEGKNYTSWIVRLDKGEKDKSKNLNTFTAYTYNTAMHLDLIYPGNKKRTEELEDYIIRDISKFEKALYSYDYDSDKYGYKKYIDVDSFVNYYIINEFTLNYDAGNMSTYLYKDAKGKINMWVWDFNSANDYYKHTTKIDDLQFQWNTWYYMLMKDEDFTNRILNRYRYLREYELSDKYLLNYIDDIVEYLGDAIDRNYEVWGYTFSEEEDYLEPTERNVRSYDEAIKQLKNNIVERAKFLDENLETIKQFSHESKVKKFNH